MGEERWMKWLAKAKKLNQKYFHNKTLILAAVTKHKPAFMRQYDADESLILLLLLYRVVGAQKLLYKTFIRGGDFFISRIKDADGDYRHILDDYNDILRYSKSIQHQIEREYDELHKLQPLFDSFEGSVELKDVESGMFSQRINETHLEHAASRLAALVPKAKARTVKKVHRKVLTLNDIQLREYRTIKRLIKHAVSFKSALYLNLSNPRSAKNVAPYVYAGAYIGFFAGIISYDIFSPVSSMARELMEKGV
jgi:hypothetical protein